MFSALSDYARLLRAGWTLMRRDALIPREFAHLAPAPLRVFGALTDKDIADLEQKVKTSEGDQLKATIIQRRDKSSELVTELKQFGKLAGAYGDKGGDLNAILVRGTGAMGFHI